MQALEEVEHQWGTPVEDGGYSVPNHCTKYDMFTITLLQFFFYWNGKESELLSVPFLYRFSLIFCCVTKTAVRNKTQ